MTETLVGIWYHTASSANRVACIWRLAAPCRLFLRSYLPNVSRSIPTRVLRTCVWHRVTLHCITASWVRWCVCSVHCTLESEFLKSYLQVNVPAEQHWASTLTQTCHTQHTRFPLQHLTIQNKCQEWSRVPALLHREILTLTACLHRHVFTNPSLYDKKIRRLTAAGLAFYLSCLDSSQIEKKCRHLWRTGMPGLL